MKTAIWQPYPSLLCGVFPVTPVFVDGLRFTVGLGAVVEAVVLVRELEEDICCLTRK